jgi:hypothetical protein
VSITRLSTQPALDEVINRHDEATYAGGRGGSIRTNQHRIGAQGSYILLVSDRGVIDPYRSRYCVHPARLKKAIGDASRTSIEKEVTQSEYQTSRAMYRWEKDTIMDGSKRGV